MLRKLHLTVAQMAPDNPGEDTELFIDNRHFVRERFVLYTWYSHKQFILCRKCNLKLIIRSKSLNCEEDMFTWDYIGLITRKLCNERKR